MTAGRRSCSRRRVRPRLHAGEATLFAGAMTTYLIDPHGSGLSTPPPDPSQYSFAGCAAFYEEVRRALGLGEVVLVGHSSGASTALTYAALAPDVVTACVAVGGLCVSPAVDPDLGAAWGEAFERRAGRHAGAEWYPEARRVWDTWDEQVMGADDPRDIVRMMMALHRLYAGYPDRPDVAAGLRPLLGQIACPTLVVAGEFDCLGGLVQAQPICDGVPGARLELIPDCGHFPVLEATQTYSEAVTGVLRALP